MAADPTPLHLLLVESLVAAGQHSAAAEALDQAEAAALESSSYSEWDERLRRLRTRIRRDA